MKLPGCITYKNHEIIIIFKKNLEGLGFMVFNATFNNISVLSCHSVLLVEETGGSGENLPNTKIQFYRKIKSMIKKNEIRSVPTYHTMVSDAITEVQYGTVEVASV
jgi:hypothetical protein